MCLQKYSLLYYYIKKIIYRGTWTTRNNKDLFTKSSHLTWFYCNVLGYVSADGPSEISVSGMASN